MIDVLTWWLARSRCSGIICWLLVAGALVAGLWPFNPFPRNDVSWLKNRNGLHFGTGGIVLSPGNFLWPASPSSACLCTLEIFVQPGMNPQSSSILTFYSPDAPQRIRLFQWMG